MNAAARSVVCLIAAVARNGAIGRDNGLLWSHPEDLKRFRRVTMGQPVVMGRRTWDSLPARFRPLPGRRNVVVTRQVAWAADGAEAALSLAAALAQAQPHHGAMAAANPPPDRVWVIGGGQLYAEALPLADELHLTEIDADLSGDTHFPDWPRGDFDEVAREVHQAEDGTRFDFVTYRRKSPQQPQD